jgi:hypothetical protein
MIVSDLIRVLQQLPQDAPIAYTYETVVCFIWEDDIFISKDGVVLIGDDYRDDFVSGRRSAGEKLTTKNYDGNCPCCGNNTFTTTGIPGEEICYFCHISLKDKQS